jgi:predicted metal-dependent hydrolase
LLKGIDEFNHQLYFECHETLESIWIREPDSVRYLYQGILLVGVGFYHWRRGNWRGAVAKLRQGADKLQWFRPVCMTVDVERLIRESEGLRRELEALGPTQLPAFPPPDLPQVHRILTAA